MIKFNDTAVSIVESTELVNGGFLRTRALGFYCVRLVGMKAALDDAILLLMQSALSYS